LSKIALTGMFAASAVSVLALGTAHDVSVNELDGIRFSTKNDLAYAHRRLTYIGSTFVPVDHRPAVVDSILRLIDRAKDSGLEHSDIDQVVKAANAATKKIEKQPVQMAKVPNGAGAHTGDFPGQPARADQGTPVQQQQQNQQ
jgi:hypothetical protein